MTSFGSPLTPRTSNDTWLKIGLMFSSMAIVGSAFQPCESIPKLSAFAVSFIVLKFVNDFVSLWYNLPSSPAEKNKLADESPRNKTIIDLTGLLQLPFLGVSVWGFCMVVPYWFSGGPDDCSAALFITASICSGIPVVICSVMLLYFVGATVVRKACDGEREEGEGKKEALVTEEKV